MWLMRSVRSLSLCAVGGGAWLVYALHTVVARQSAPSLFNDWLYDGLILFAFSLCLLRAIRVSHERLAWAAMAAGVGFWTAGDIYYGIAFSGSSTVPFPSWADLGYLGFYPFAYVSLFLLVRSRITRLTASVWIDALIAAFATVGIGASFVVQRVLEATDGGTATVVTNLAYPVGDTLLVAMIVGVFAITGFRPGRAWAVIGLGLVASAVADSVYLVAVATNSYSEGGPIDALWPAGMLLIAAAAWLPAKHRAFHARSQALTIPGIFGLCVIGLVLYEPFAKVNLLAASAIAATLLCLMLRGGLAILENRRLLERTQTEAVTDALTGLGNRRKLTHELELTLKQLTLGVRRPVVLALFDLDGFKGYNDRFGHPAGDVLLARLAAKLDTLVRHTGGSAYRMGGDEFCVLLADGADVDLTIAQCRVALSEDGEGFVVAASVGTVRLPDEASTPSDALKTADRRLYANKSLSRMSPLSQTKEVLVRLLAERELQLGRHVAQVAELAELTATKLGLAQLDVADTRLAAELHDIGKAAIPDAILHKRMPLSEIEWDFIKRHTIVGERIVAAAPALTKISLIVRSTHERVDGTGYPDGLDRNAIPLPARIIAVADAYDAMISDRPYAAARSSEQALAELRRHAGTQFDAAVVEAFAAVVAELADVPLARPG
jgi:two-component system cell cycle response regulator